MLDNQYYHRYIEGTLDQYLLPMLQCSANITILGQCLYNVGLLPEIFEKISVSKIRKTSQVPPFEKFSKKFQSRKFEKPHRSLPWGNFRKNFRLENSKNLTGPSLGEIFEKISFSKIRKTSQVPPQEALPNVPSLTNVWLMLRTPTFVAILAAQYWAKLNF